MLLSVRRAAGDGCGNMEKFQRRGDRTVAIPDADYRYWVNTNRAKLKKLMEENSVETAWLRRGKNREYTERYFAEMGYTIHFD